MMETLNKIINNLFESKFKVLGLIWLILITYMIQVELTQGDDTYINSLGVTEPLSRAFTMTARFTSNLWGAFISKFNLVFWKIGTPFVLTLLIYSISNIIILNKNSDQKTSNRLHLLIFILLLYIYPMVLTSAAFWVAGSITYIWSVSLGFYSFLHFIKFYRKDDVSNISITFFFITALFASFGQEQISVLLTVSSFLFIILYYIKNRKFVNKPIIIQTLIYLIGTLNLVSPFSETRLANDVFLYYPDFPVLTLFDKIFRGSIWLINHLFFKEKFLLIFLLVLLIIYNLKYNFNEKIKCFLLPLLSIPLLIIGLSLIPFDAIINILAREIPHNYNFNISNGINKLIAFDVRDYHLNSFFEKVKYGIWLFYLFFIPLSLILNRGNIKFNFFISTIIFAAYCSASVMFFAPSIYESKHRVFLLTDILLILAIGFLYFHMFANTNIPRWFWFILFLYPLFIYFLLNWQWMSGYYVMH